jgi:hypothetical protein
LIRTALASYRPALHDALQRRDVEVVELVPAFAPAAHEARPLEHLQVLRHRLPGQPELVLHREPRADLEQGLPVSIVQLVEDRSPRGRRQRVEDIVNAGNI